MHIPNEMLTTAVCPVTAALSLGGVGLSAWAVLRSRANKELKSSFTPGRFALAGSLIFALQMLNFPIWGGISGHIAGGVLAAAILGVPGGALCMALVLALQSLLFADGGLNTLGANVFNMALIGAGLGGLLRNFLAKRCVPALAATGIAAAVGMELAALAMFAELALEGKATMGVFAALMGTHSVLALAEGLVTMGVVGLLACTQVTEKTASRRLVVTICALTALALLASPLAYAAPDALEWTLESFHLLSADGSVAFASPMPDYTLPAIGNGLVSGYVAALLGCLAVAASGLLVGGLCRLGVRRANTPAPHNPH